MKISNLVNKILTPLLYFTASQQNNEVNTQLARIGEHSWDFPPHSNFTFNTISILPYNTTFESGGFLGYEAACKSFIDKNTNNTITPKFSFNYPDNTTPVTISDCTANIQPGRIVTECPQLSFRHTHNVEICIKNENDVHVLGTDCDVGM